ncbi:MAG TPA: RNA methyltransferase substrate-binding domain-containing protein, partial [Bacteroidia bacterium]|nr:RNA methyltransferase substrate-binding domain-containing protein [Bacteroidia bacterium]
MDNRFKERLPSGDREDDQMIYGLRPVLEAVGAGKEIDRIFIGRGAKGELMQELKNQLRERNIAWTEVPAEKLNRFTRKNHQEVVCFISSIAYFSLGQLVPSLFERGVTPFLLIL